VVVEDGEGRLAWHEGGHDRVQRAVLRVAVFAALVVGDDEV
jgi:hypothetical protein